MITSINEFKKTLNENISFDKFNGLKVASTDFIPFEIVNYKIDQNVSNTVYLLQIYFIKLNSYGLCIYDETERRFIEEPGTYENFGTTPEQIEKQYGFKHNFNINENKEEICYIEFLNKDKKYKKDRIDFTGPNAFKDAIEWGRKNLEKFNADMISFDTKNANIKY